MVASREAKKVIEKGMNFISDVETWSYGNQRRKMVGYSDTWRGIGPGKNSEHSPSLS